MMNTGSGEHYIRKPKLLVLYANTGGGHLSAAKAFEAAIALRYPDQYDVTLLNVQVASGSRRVRMLYESYNLMLKADPRYAKHGMRLLNAVNAEQLMIPLLPRAYRNVRQYLLRENPDLIVSVHPIVNHAFLRALEDCGWRERVPYVIVCTDLTNNFLKGWANPGADALITFSEMAREQMVTYGVPREKVAVIDGFPVSPAFFATSATKAECRAHLGLDPSRFTILVSMGGVAIPHKTAAIVRTLADSGLPVQLLVVCGMNASLRRRMSRVARRTAIPMQVYGFTQQIPQMMTAADLMISKPGPGTIMEAVIKELPMLLDGVTEPMPQEKGNLLFAEAQGIAHTITHYRHLPGMVACLMHDHEAYAEMQARMRAIKNENAIFDIVEQVRTHLPSRLLVST